MYDIYKLLVDFHFIDEMDDWKTPCSCQSESLSKVERYVDHLICCLSKLYPGNLDCNGPLSSKTGWSSTWHTGNMDRKKKYINTTWRAGEYLSRLNPVDSRVFWVFFSQKLKLRTVEIQLKFQLGTPPSLKERFVSRSTVERIRVIRVSVTQVVQISRWHK